MPAPIQIYMIESPNADDYYNGHLETDRIQQAANFNGIQFTAHQVHTRQHLGCALDEIEPAGSYPILHIAGHGNTDGFALASGSVLITWDELRDRLLPVNARMSNTLILCMSSCEGWNAMQMAYNAATEQPFLAAVGTLGKPTVADTAVAFTTLYHYLCSGKNLLEGVEAMKAASLHKEWNVLTAAQAKEIHIHSSIKAFASRQG